MPDYAKMKNAELEALLKQRSLPHTGKKAEMVARLQDADKADAGNESATTTPAPTTTETSKTAATAEDEIDWDDDNPTEAAKAASTEAGAVAIAAGGKGQVANPQAVPNQEAAVDPSQTDDLSVQAEPKGEDAATKSAEDAEGPTEAEKKDFASGLKDISLDEELEKRKARAKKFGITEDDETQKKLERAKKFGIEASEGISGLNEALPERRPKRVRDAGEDGRRGNSKRRGRGGRPAPGRGGGGNERQGSNRAANGSSGTWMSDADRAAAEARKARFAGAPAAS
ncbi:uncharacterized protein J3D65DRAFT_344731 [Phyllosticta citribraziliensis]|uniref:SAP domain-containing protein n=1 Tax=Phyllosticta citribraziliensis TaxID=989973 RepID=A0ABR1LUA8_9PEZI